MTAGSKWLALLVLAWSQVHGLLAFYALWIGIGLVMAAVLYEPAFTVLAKWFPRSVERRRAMTAMTLAGALASFIFLPLAQALIDIYGWRDALLALAVILALGRFRCMRSLSARRRRWTRPSIRTPPRPPARRCARPRSGCSPGRSSWRPAPRSPSRSRASRSCSSEGNSPAFAAFSIGVIGVSQIPGRLLFAPLAERLPHPGDRRAVRADLLQGSG